MTDKELLMEILNRGKIPFHLKDPETYYQHYDLTIEADNDKADNNLEGYQGFQVNIDFNEDGTIKLFSIVE